MSAPREGIYAALWTPTDAEGRVLTAELKAILDFLRPQGLHGLMVLGSTGHFLHLSSAARRQVLETVMGHGGRWRVIANVSDMRLARVVELGRLARDLGAATAALLPPWYFPLRQEDQAEFFVRAGQAVELPLFLYNFPERTGNRINLETIAAVADRTPVGGIKQSGREFDYHGPLVALGREKGFVVFTGGEDRLAAAMTLGVSGCVTGLANAVPELVLEIFRAAQAGDAARAQQATNKVRQLGRCISVLDFPLDVAASVAARGLPAGQPKTPLSAGTRARFEAVVAEAKGLYREWGLV